MHENTLHNVNLGQIFVKVSKCCQFNLKQKHLPKNNKNVLKYIIQYWQMINISQAFFFYKYNAFINYLPVNHFLFTDKLHVLIIIIHNVSTTK